MSKIKLDKNAQIILLKLEVKELKRKLIEVCKGAKNVTR